MTNIEYRWVKFLALITHVTESFVLNFCNKEAHNLRRIDILLAICGYLYVQVQWHVEYHRVTISVSIFIFQRSMKDMLVFIVYIHCLFGIASINIWTIRKIYNYFVIYVWFSPYIICTSISNQHILFNSRCSLCNLIK